MTSPDIKNKILYWILVILTISFGMFFVIYGEIDDSPGGQVIGFVLVIAGVVSIFKSKKKI